MLPLIQVGAGASGTFPSTMAKVATKFLDSYNSVTGLFTQSQPAFTDISGTVAAAQLPNPSASTLGGIQSLAAVTSKWINAISTAGVPSATQPAFSDISGAASLTSQVTGVLPPANGGVAALSTGGQGYFVSAGLLNCIGIGTPSAVVTAGQQVYCFQFVLPFAMTVGRVSIGVAVGVASSTVTVGIYNASGNKLIDSGTFSGAANANLTNTFTGVLLPPGVYYFVQSASTQTTLTVQTTPQALYNATGAALLNLQTTKKVGTAANPAVSGVLPASLGTITAASGVNMAFASWEP